MPELGSHWQARTFFDRDLATNIQSWPIGAGGGTRTHTTLPSRDFKSLASTSSATSASLILHSFLSFAPQIVSSISLGVSKTGANLFTLHPF